MCMTIDLPCKLNVNKIMNSNDRQSIATHHEFMRIFIRKSTILGRWAGIVSSVADMSHIAWSIFVANETLPLKGNYGHGKPSPILKVIQNESNIRQ